MMNSYEAYKNLYDKVKPIRGRSTEVRPIGNRRRDWEQITRKVLPNGSFSYVARLYGTDVVEYLPDGSIILRSGGWSTPSTAEFIHEHSPFMCWKQHKRLWIRVRNEDDVKAYPVGDELHMKWHEGGYVPAQPIVIHKRVVDRDKAKIARKRCEPFLQWVKTFLALSDGWVMHETCKDVLGEHGKDAVTLPRYADFHARSTQPVALYEQIVCPGAGDPVFLRVLCLMTHAHLNVLEDRVAEIVDFRVSGIPRGIAFRDKRVDFFHVRDVVNRWLRQFGDVDKVVATEPTDKAIYRVE